MFIINSLTPFQKSKASIEKIPIPVRYEMRGFNSLLGSHYDHYYLDYDSFSIDRPNDDVFKMTESEKLCCTITIIQLKKI